MNILKRASVSLAKKPEEAPAITDGKDDESKRPSFSLKGRLSLSLKGKPKSDAPGTSSSTESGKASGYSKATADEAHPYEDINSLPDRRRAASRKSVTWKDPQTNDLAEVLRARSKSVKDKEGRRTSVSWAQAPLSESAGKS